MVARHAAAPAATSSSSSITGSGADLVTSEVTIVGTDPLEARIDELSQQLLGARDAALGAEIELGVARARVAELERQVHLRDVEIAELRERVAGPRGAEASVEATMAAARSSAARVGRRLRRALDT